MGSHFELNDTLQLTREQGFPQDLSVQKHLLTAYSANDFKDRFFEFKEKPDLRVFLTPPVRVFLAENINGKWIYWGLVHILELKWDCLNKTTSGKFKIIDIFPPDKMKEIFQLIDQRPEKDYFRTN